MKKIIFWLFAILLLLVPLILWPFTSEVFEFNKMVLVYILTTLIVGCWLTRSILVKKFIFRRTILDIPLLVFIASQFISTVFSMDPRTSWLGYYSRFNGGLVSVMCYALLYWAFVSNLDRKSALRALYSALISASLVSIYGILEHFGIDKNIWVQDVQSRVFSTLGQPNWLAAWLVALMPITWAIAISNFQFPISNEIQNTKSKIKSIIPYLLSILFFVVLLFTGSRSGLLGFAAADGIFWIYVLAKFKKKFVKPFVICHLSFVILALILGTELTPSISSLIKHSTIIQPTSQSQGTALETGGTESGTIRKIVWKGALQVWLHYPVFGTGVETFAYSYYLYRPAEHNLTSEWDFIYNKAHNEYLNFAANSGIVGLLSYLIMIGFSIFQIIKVENPLTFALLAGYVSILVTNFFGFSVVPIQLEFFLFPALAVTLAISEKPLVINKIEIKTGQKILIFIILITIGYLLIIIVNYWRADYLYAEGRSYNSIKRPDIAINYLDRAIKLEPGEPLYHDGLATSYVSLALTYNQQKDTEAANQFGNLATSETEKAGSLSPASVILKRTEYGVFANLAAINSGYLVSARDTLIAAVALAPTDAKLHYYLGLTYARIGQIDLSLKTLEETIALKSDYQDAKDAYAIILRTSSNLK